MSGIKRFYESDAMDATVLLCEKHEKARRRRGMTLHAVPAEREREKAIYAIETCCTDCEAPRVERMLRRLIG